jgi:hypothetical protein
MERNAAWATTVGAATPQDMVVCGGYTGGLKQSLLRAGAHWWRSVSCGRGPGLQPELL